MPENTLEELKNFEKEQSDLLENIKNNSEKQVEKAKKETDTRLKQEKEKLEKEKQAKIEKANLDAKTQSKSIVKEYKDGIKGLERKSTKNFDNALDKIFSETLK